MMRVMVVEDEEMIRKGIVMAVDWAALDCIVVGEVVIRIFFKKSKRSTLTHILLLCN